MGVARAAARRGLGRRTARARARGARARRACAGTHAGGLVVEPPAAASAASTRFYARLERGARLPPTRRSSDRAPTSWRRTTATLRAAAAHAVGRAARQRLLRDDLLRRASPSSHAVVRRPARHAAERSARRRRGHCQRRTGACGCSGSPGSRPLRCRGLRRALADAATLADEDRSSRGCPASCCAESYRAYLDKFGERCLNELKLESPTLHDDPLPLLRAVGQLAQQMRRRNDSADPDPEGSVRRPPARRRRASGSRRRWRANRCAGSFSTGCLRHARARVRDRENLRFERTRLFGRVRRIFVETGAAAARDGPARRRRATSSISRSTRCSAFVEGRATHQPARPGGARRKRRVRSEYRDASRRPDGQPSSRRAAGISRTRLSAAPASRGTAATALERQRRESDAAPAWCGPRPDRQRSVDRAAPRSAGDPGRGAHRSRLDHGVPVRGRPGRRARQPAVACGDRRARAGHAGGRVGARASPRWLQTATGWRWTARTGRRATVAPRGGAVRMTTATAPAEPRAPTSPRSVTRSVWEDADILVEALGVAARGRCVSICSAGDNTLAMLSRERCSWPTCSSSRSASPHVRLLGVRHD